jgi:hypothetical protein
MGDGPVTSCEESPEPKPTDIPNPEPTVPAESALGRGSWEETAGNLLGETMMSLFGFSLDTPSVMSETLDDGAPTMMSLFGFSLDTPSVMSETLYDGTPNPCSPTASRALSVTEESLFPASNPCSPPASNPCSPPGSRAPSDHGETPVPEAPVPVGDDRTELVR